MKYNAEYIWTKNTESSLIGNKAQQLFVLQELGYSVPAFFVISATLMSAKLDLFTNEIATIKQEIVEERISLEQGATKLQNLVSKITFSAEETAKFDEQVAELFPHDEWFSVRSSGQDEDKENTSFAGQFNSFLNVNKTDLLAYVIKCWQSTFSLSLLSYCQNQQLNFATIRMGVIIQKMVIADYAGIVFTANPQGLLNELVVVSGAASGDAVVSDKAEVVTYYINKDDGRQYYEKDDMAELLPPDYLQQLVNIGEAVAQKYEKPMDLEFTINAGKIYLLQARPITTLALDEITILDNSNIVESYPHISLPLTQSFAKHIYYGIFKSLARRCLPSEKMVEDNDGIFREMVTAVNGRMYYKISNWYHVLKFLPFQKKIIPVWQQMLGVTSKNYNMEKAKTSWLFKLQVNLRIITNFFRVVPNMRKLDKNFQTIYADFQKQNLEELSNENLLELYNHLEKEILQNWDITLINDLYAFIFTGLVEHELKKQDTQNFKSIANDFISGIQNIESMKPIYALQNLVEQIKKDEKLKAKIGALSYKYDSEDLTEYPEIKKQIDEYIAQFGDRGLEELKLETQTFRTNPELLLKLLIQYCEMEQPLAAASSTQTPAFANFQMTKRIKYFSQKATLGIKNREQSRLNRCKIFGMVREIYLTIGKDFTRQNIIEKQTDIFYLTEAEINDLVKAKNIAKNYQTVIAERKTQLALWENLPTYNRLVFAGLEFNKTVNVSTSQQETNNKGHKFSGVPCANGTVTAEVIVVTKPTLDLDVQGKIIITKTTDPGWVFLLAQAVGVIAEKGSILSHTAIISRELKITAIVNVDKITEKLQNGDIVKMNGNTGEIEVIEFANI